MSGGDDRVVTGVCGNCGSPVHGTRFCVRCGAEVAADRATVAATQPTVTSAPTRRTRRWLLPAVVAVIAALAAVAASAVIISARQAPAANEVIANQNSGAGSAPEPPADATTPSPDPTSTLDPKAVEVANSVWGDFSASRKKQSCSGYTENPAAFKKGFMEQLEDGMGFTREEAWASWEYVHVRDCPGASPIGVTPSK